ncbi:MAG: 3D domain-containing protein [Parcubacteria group bacterium]|nr:3D domain-containing protein [Parcubacteria group bacterium]
MSKRKNFRINENLTLGDRLIVGILGIALLSDLLFPKVAIAGEPEDFCNTIPHEIYCGVEDTIELPSLPISKDVPIKTFWVYVTAYSSTPDQTDDTPFITANGTYVYDGIVATNILPFKMRIKFPDEYGDKWFVVEDRMNRRYNGKNRMDIWMKTREEAIQFGARWLEAEVY